MAEAVCPYGRHPRSRAGMAHDGRDPTRPERPYRGKGPQEHLAVHGAVLAPPLEVSGDRSADVGWQRETVLVAPFAMDHDLSATPADVLQAQAGYLASAQPEAQKGEQHGVIAPAFRLAPVARAEQGSSRLLVDPHRQRRPVARGDSNGRRGQVDRRQPLEEAEAQKRAESCHKELRRVR